MKYEKEKPREDSQYNNNGYFPGRRRGEFLKSFQNATACNEDRLFTKSTIIIHTCHHEN